MQYGASKEEWALFDIVLGLTQDLLPVVSNPNAKISENSNISDKGKVPSYYNQFRNVVGFSGWTSHKTTEKHILKWSNEPDYGICLQTRTIRALDVDVEDSAKSAKIRKFVTDTLGFPLPCRFRSNSGKLLLAFSMPGEFAKRRGEVDGGVIEFLANGQQFIACGHHPSGVKYEWDGGIPTFFPEITPDQFEALWA